MGIYNRIKQARISKSQQLNLPPGFCFDSRTKHRDELIATRLFDNHNLDIFFYSWICGLWIHKGTVAVNNISITDLCKLDEKLCLLARNNKVRSFAGQVSSIFKSILL